MNIQEKNQELYKKSIQLFESQAKRAACAMPSGCYFLSADDVLCEKRKKGDARYPYSCDGLTFWAYSSGNAKIEESTFNVILPFAEGREPNVCFYVGVKNQCDNSSCENGILNVNQAKYIPVSVTGAGKLPFESGVSRWTVFSPEAARYYVKTSLFTACLAAYVSNDKKVRFSFSVENISDKPLEIYTSAYFDLMLSHAPCENIETKWYRRAKYGENKFDFSVTEYINRTQSYEHSATLEREKCGYKSFNTTSRSDYRGGAAQLCNAEALFNGEFEDGVFSTEFTDTAIAGDIIPVTLSAGENNNKFTVEYALTVNGGKVSDGFVPANVGADIPAMNFKGEWGKVNSQILSDFIKNVHRQNEFCARAKNYAGPYIGIRDIFQQLESALIWIPEYCRGKIVEAIGYIGENGRAPRQYSYPARKGAVPPMDLRPFIDQGVWIISTVYTYLCWTGDFGILNEECGYYKFDGDKVLLCDERDSVLCHLFRIANYLESNLDEQTDCLHALYGDWNDALDGLGKTDNAGKEFGTGVSVMATLQFCQNLKELCEICEKLGKTAEKDKYAAVYNRVKNGLLKYAVTQNAVGERKILHGWGDDRSWFVGSYNDNDGESRDGLTATAFWVLSGALSWDESLKKDILAAYSRLDSKYGLKTFNPYFSRENDKVGRINRLPKGTAENGAVYIHATLFAIRSLFAMGENEAAWAQIYKILPPAHEFITTTPFVMPNSYIENSEKGFDGESMSDWFTGSGCVLLKTLYFDAFGLKADLNGLTINPAGNLPVDEMSVSVKVRNAKVNVTLKKDNGKRAFKVNGKEVQAENGKLRIDGSDLSGEITVEALV